MLDFLRRQSALIYAIFGGIVVMFAFNFGPGQGSCLPERAGPSWVARVEGDPIGRAAFAMRYRGQVARLGALARAEGEVLDEALLERLNLRQRVLEQLIDTKLLAHDHARLGLVVDDATLRSYLESQFGAADVDFATYRTWVRQEHEMSVERFEAEARESIAAQQMVQLLQALTVTSPADVLLDARAAADQVRLSFVRFALDRQAVVAPGPEARQALVAAEPEALEAFYRAEPSLYREPARLELERWRAPAGAASPEASLAQLRDALAAAGRARAAAAEQQPAALPGQAAPLPAGEPMGWVDPATLAPAEAGALAGLGEGQFSPVVAGPEGPVLFGVRGARPARRLPLEEVRDRVAGDVLRERAATAAAAARAGALHARLAAGAAWPVAAAAGREAVPAPEASGWLHPYDAQLPGLGPSETLARLAFASPDLAAEAGEARPRLLPEVVRVGDSFVVAAVTGRRRPDRAALESRRPELRQARLEALGEALVTAHLGRRRLGARIDLAPPGPSGPQPSEA